MTTTTLPTVATLADRARGQTCAAHGLPRIVALTTGGRGCFRCCAEMAAAWAAPQNEEE